MAQHHQRHVLRDLQVLLRVHRTGHGQARREVRAGEDLVDAGRRRAQHAQAAKGREHPGGQAPQQHGLDLVGCCLGRFEVGMHRLVRRQAGKGLEEGPGGLGL
ncbi:MAG: hypothetical protein ACKO6D_13615, partial [Rubrivivax sp.]